MTSSSAPAKAALPLFYVRPEPLNAERHGALSLHAQPDFRFAAATNAVPIMTAEFAEAMRFYPIVFAGDPAHPVAVQGMKGQNLFVDADGQWTQAHYIPAYVRRYPFVFIDAGERGFALGIDMGCDRVKPAAGEAGFLPLFDGVTPAEVTQGALHFSTALQAEHNATRAFATALIAHDLLVDQQAHGTFPGGEPFAVQGFRVVDAEKLAALPADVIADWHKNGWLGLIQLHLVSLARWRDLLDRQAQSPATAAQTAA